MVRTPLPVAAVAASLIIGALVALPASAGATPQPEETAIASPTPTSGARTSSPTPAVTRAPGMDISHYQGNVGWTQVGNGAIRFSLTRASHGYEKDTEYEDNRQGAYDNDVFFGAYHYAEPKGTTQGAIDQADYFLSLATPQSGDIIPVLDIEQTNGKSPGRLVDWVAAFLKRVENQTGVKAIIYTSPSFWETAMGNTKRFARRGHMLWIANWEVNKPTVPAGNWAGHGWTFWQWTDCRSVNGIQGCVDGDRYIRENLGKVTIP